MNISFLSLLALILITLKLCGIISISWFIVVLPIIIIPIIILIIFIITLIASLIIER